MQLFTCPFCGPRDEREFHYGGEFGKQRPDTAGEVGESEWSDYLFRQANPRGRTEEIWTHVTCQEIFRMVRDTVTMEVLETTALRKQGQ